MPKHDFEILVADGEKLAGSIASELGQRLKNMWNELPWSIMGFFGEE